MKSRIKKLLKETKLNFKSFILTLLVLVASFRVSYAAGSKKMFSLDNTDFVVLISFLLFLGILIYFKVPSIIAAFLDKRSNDIQDEIQRASEILEEAKKILSSVEAEHIKAGETIENMVKTAKGRAVEEEDKAKKHIEGLMKNKLLSAEGQVKSTERKILEEIEELAIDLSVEKVRIKLSKSLSSNDYNDYFDTSIKSVEKGLRQVYR